MISHIFSEDGNKVKIRLSYLSISLQFATPTYSEFCYSDQMTSSMLKFHFYFIFGANNMACGLAKLQLETPSYRIYSRGGNFGVSNLHIYFHKMYYYVSTSSLMLMSNYQANNDNFSKNILKLAAPWSWIKLNSKHNILSNAGPENVVEYCNLSGGEYVRAWPCQG